MTRWTARVVLSVLAGLTFGLCVVATVKNLPVIAVEAGILCGGALTALRLGPGANAGRHRIRHQLGRRGTTLWAQARDRARREAGPDDD